MTDDYFELLKSLELRLLDPSMRASVPELERLIAEDFREVAASGREFGIDEVRSRLPAELGVEFTTHDLSVRMLTDDVGLVTYVGGKKLGDGGFDMSKRVSIWVRHEADWRMAFHQGTPLGSRLALLRDNLRKSEERVLARVEEMRDHCLVFPTPNGGGHTLWVLGHLSYIEGLVIHGFMLGETNPVAEWQEPFDGADVSGDIGDYPSFDEVLDRCRAMRRSTLDLVDSLSESDLDRKSASTPQGHKNTFGTYRLCLQFVSDHWYMHRGQLADARRAAGLERMWF